MMQITFDGEVKYLKPGIKDFGDEPTAKEEKTEFDPEAVPYVARIGLDESRRILRELRYIFSSR